MIVIEASIFAWLECDADDAFVHVVVVVTHLARLAFLEAVDLVKQLRLSLPVYLLLTQLFHAVHEAVNEAS
jgi:hypothetical protein